MSSNLLSRVSAERLYTWWEECIPLGRWGWVALAPAPREAPPVLLLLSVGWLLPANAATFLVGADGTTQQASSSSKKLASTQQRSTCATVDDQPTLADTRDLLRADHLQPCIL